MTVRRAAAEVLMAYVDSGVDHIYVHATAVTDGLVHVVEGEADLVDAVQTPGGDRTGPDDAVLFDVFYGIGFAELSDEKIMRTGFLFSKF